MLEEMTDALILVEMFDTKYELSPSKRYVDKDIDNKHGVSDHSVQNISGGEHGELHVYKHRGAYEIHHVNADGVSGEFVPHGIGANPKFVSTILSAGKKLLDQGHRVRIVAYDKMLDGEKSNMFDRYNRLTNKLAKTHDWAVTTPTDHTMIGMNTDGMKEITISRIKDNPLHTQGIRREIVMKRNNLNKE